MKQDIEVVLAEIYQFLAKKSREKSTYFFFSKKKIERLNKECVDYINSKANSIDGFPIEESETRVCLRSDKVTIILKKQASVKEIKIETINQK